MTLDEAIERVQDRLCCVLTDDVRKETIAMRGFLLELKAYREAASKDEALDKITTYMHDFGEEV